MSASLGLSGVRGRMILGTGARFYQFNVRAVEGVPNREIQSADKLRQWIRFLNGRLRGGRLATVDPDADVQPAIVLTRENYL